MATTEPDDEFDEFDEFDDDPDDDDPDDEQEQRGVELRIQASLGDEGHHLLGDGVELAAVAEQHHAEQLTVAGAEPGPLQVHP